MSPSASDVSTVVERRANPFSQFVSTVAVRFESNEGLTTVHIDDDGPGIPEADRKKIFEPFVRLDSSRDRKTGGTGLGLAIAHRICKSHHGSLTASESPEGGARFSVELPG